MKAIFTRAKALTDSGAWLLIVIGLVLFAARIPLGSGGFINLPVVATVLQTVGLMFSLAGIQIMISMFVWPNLRFSKLCEEACGENRSTAAALIIFGLLIYNGLSLIGMVLWLSSALGAGLGGAT